MEQQTLRNTNKYKRRRRERYNAALQERRDAWQKSGTRHIFFFGIMWYVLENGTMDSIPASQEARWRKAREALD
jgi:hypothetical protein